MPKAPNLISINIDLLKPQGKSERLYVRLTRWLLSTGRYIIIAVELVVLAAFVSRFKLDADLAATKEAIEQQIPFIESQKADELLIRQTQSQLATIRQVRETSPDFLAAIKQIASQTPQGIKTTNISLEKESGKINLKVSGQSRNNNELSVFVLILKQDATFANINLASISLDNGIINFTVTGNFNQNNIDKQLKL